MTLDEITRQGINPALQLLPSRMDSPQARVQLLATGLQESRFKYRFQTVAGRPYVKGPARSFWQGERGGGMVRGVRTHPGSAALAGVLYRARDVAADDNAIWNAIETDDVLAAGLARLLLWTDPLRLPDFGDVQGAWELYARTWRPGKPHRQTWDAYYMQALEYVVTKAKEP